MQNPLRERRAFNQASSQESSADRCGREELRLVATTGPRNHKSTRQQRTGGNSARKCSESSLTAGR